MTGLNMKSVTRRINEWLIVVLAFIVVVSAISFIRGEIYFLPDKIHYIFNFHPTTVIMGINTVNAIEVFGGNDPSPYLINWETASMLFNVILYLMLGPYLLFMGYKKSKERSNRSKPWYWYIGGMVCIGSFAVIPVEVIHITVYERTKAGAEISRVRDMMRAELTEVGFATAQHEILKDGLSDSFKIEDLNLEDLEFEYTVENVSADTLVKIVVSNPEIPDFEVSMEIRPYDENLMIQRN